MCIRWRWQRCFNFGRTAVEKSARRPLAGELHRRTENRCVTRRLITISHAHVFYLLRAVFGGDTVPIHTFAHLYRLIADNFWGLPTPITSTRPPKWFMNCIVIVAELRSPSPPLPSPPPTSPIPPTTVGHRSGEKPAAGVRTSLN